MIASLTAGGAERVAAVMAEHWAALGHSVTLLTYTSRVADHYQVSNKVRRTCIDLLWESDGVVSRIASAVRRWRLLRSAILYEPVDVVVSFGDVANVRVLLSCLGERTPIVVAERTDPRQHALSISWRVLRRLLYMSAAAVVVQTDSVAHWARHVVPTKRVRVIPNPVRPLPQRVPRPIALGTRRVIIAVGRLGREKGFDVLLNAYSRAALPTAEWQLVILGEGSERPALETQIRALGLFDQVQLPGIVAEPTQWLQYAELFVLPSRFEGFPNALLEAMSCGLPVVAFDCPSGPGEIVRHEQTGLLVAPGDTDALTTAISRLALDPKLGHRLGAAAALDVAQRFNLDRVGALWEAVWEDVLDRPMYSA